MSELTLAQQEAKYDAERSGAAWLKIQAITDDPTNDGRDIPLSADEARVIDILLNTPVIPSRDEAHRQQRWNNILGHVATLDEAEQAEALAFMERLLGMLK